jgi:hypothetical protein
LRRKSYDAERSGADLRRSGTARGIAGTGSAVGQERAVIEALTNPDQVRVSKTDPSVFLFYRKMGRKFLCVVTKRATPAVGFVMTAYFTDKVKEGETAWKK